MGERAIRGTEEQVLRQPCTATKPQRSKNSAIAPPSSAANVTAKPSESSGTCGQGLIVLCTRRPRAGWTYTPRGRRRRVRGGRTDPPGVATIRSAMSRTRVKNAAPAARTWSARARATEVQRLPNLGTIIHYRVQSGFDSGLMIDARACARCIYACTRRRCVRTLSYLWPD
jgi:hypothetical protein